MYNNIEDKLIDAAHYQKMIDEVLECLEKRHGNLQEKIIITCPMCEGEGCDGHDRCVPPNPYICEVCNGYGKIELRPIGTIDEYIKGKNVR